MEILIVRHGDPDYERDSLTYKGVEEARLLADRLSKIEVTDFYCSPLGRAQKTASYTLDRVGKTAETLPWLTEFEGKVKKGLFGKTSCWDRKPAYWTAIPDYYSYDRWHKVKLMKQGGVYKQYKEVCDGIDELLRKYGYNHKGKIFQVEKESHARIVLFLPFRCGVRNSVSYFRHFTYDNVA